MKNNTKIRLHLSKQLFESLTKQVLAEAKMTKEALGGYTEVKMPKANKAAEKMTNKMQKMEEIDAQSATKKMSKIKEVNAQTDTKKMQKMDEKMSSKEKMAKGLYKEDEMEEGSINESEILNQLQNFLTTQVGSSGDAVSVGSILAGLAGIGVSPAIINQLHKWWEKKHPESFKKAQGISATMDRQAGNTPGQGTGVDTRKTFGPR